MISNTYADYPGTNGDTTHWNMSDLATLAREYLGLFVDHRELERISLQPTIRGLLGIVHASPGDHQAVQEWADSLPPNLRDTFTRAWDDAIRGVSPHEGNGAGDNNGGGHNNDSGTDDSGTDTTVVPFGAVLNRSYNQTDLGNAERLVSKFGTQIRYCHPWKKWLYWDGRRWNRDRTGVLNHCAKRTVRAIYTEESDHTDEEVWPSLRAWAKKSEEAKLLTALVKLAESESNIPILPECMDTNPWLLNCLNCTLDLRVDAPRLTRPHDQADMITKLAPVTHDPGATCPRWLSTLALVFAGDAALIRYWQQLSGIALTGCVNEQILPILYGTGSNGKSTIVVTQLGMLGPDYAMKAPPNFLMMRSHEAHPTELADLHGKRLVAAVETGENVRINEVLIKELTGKDSLRARRMREDFWEFIPTHKVWLATNHRPAIRGTDHALWRRIREIPFTVAIPEQEAIKDMDRLLMSEYSGILNWCIEGCLDWQTNGLITPQVIFEATAEYRAEQDILVQFFDAACIVASRETQIADAEKPVSKIAIKINAKQLHTAFNNWLVNNTNRGPMAPHEFSRQMIDHGYEPRTDHATRTLWYIGINLQSERHADKATDTATQVAE